jgi:hypothetical protein
MLIQVQYDVLSVRVNDQDALVHEVEDCLHFLVCRKRVRVSLLLQLDWELWPLLRNGVILDISVRTLSI